jgi:uncharacterized membrane protein YeaQ/YmgE (transglycosylase-associated protein family)
MLAFLVAGVILGVLARVLHHEPDDPSPVLTVVLGAVAAAASGGVMNLLLGDDLTALTPWSFTASCVVTFVLLGLLEGVWWRRT